MFLDSERHWVPDRCVWVAVQHVEEVDAIRSSHLPARTCPAVIGPKNRRVRPAAAADSTRSCQFARISYRGEIRPCRSSCQVRRLFGPIAACRRCGADRGPHQPRRRSEQARDLRLCALEGVPAVPLRMLLRRHRIRRRNRRPFSRPSPSSARPPSRPDRSSGDGPRQRARGARDYGLGRRTLADSGRHGCSAGGISPGRIS